MASSGSSGNAASGSRSFGFGSDDVLCSYDDYTPPDPAKGRRSDPSVKDFHESRTGRPLVSVSDQQEGYPKDDVISAVEKCMKKYADNLLRFLEGISGRLSQLELHSYKLERSIGEFQSDIIQDQKENDLKLRSLEKHLQEVHRSIQILRDKQELAETQKELSKLQLVQKESTTLSHSQKNEEGVAPPISEPKRHELSPDMPNQQLALVSRQTTALPPSRAAEQNPYLLNQAGTFYGQHQPLPQDQQSPPQPALQYGQPKPQIQDQVTAPQQQTSFPQYQQQWPQAPPQQFPPQQPPPQAQIRPLTPPTYPHQPNNPYSAVPQPGGSHAEAVSYGYGGPGSIQRQPQPTGAASYPPQANLHAVYSADGSRVAQNFLSGGYPPPSNASAQNQPVAVGLHQPMRGHPFGEMIERAVSMGYSRDQVVSVIHRMGETGQPVDFNALLDRLNARAAAVAAPRGWSG